MLGSNLKPVKGDLAVDITSVDCPSVVRAGDNFWAAVYGEYQSSGPFSMDVAIVEINGFPGHQVAKDTYTSGIQDPVSGKWEVVLHLTAYTPNANEYDASGKFVWKLEATVFGIPMVPKLFTVTILKQDAAPYAKITVHAEDSSDAEVSEVSVEELFGVVVILDYSVPDIHTCEITLSFKNSPTCYDAWEKTHLEADGWVRVPFMSQFGGNSGTANAHVSGFAPPDPLPDWRWDIEVQVKTPSGQASDKATLHLPVKERKQLWGAFSPDESSAPTYVQPSQTFQVTLTGNYIFPQTGNLGIAILDDKDKPLEPPPFPNTVRYIGKFKGKGTFSETFSLKAPDTEGTFTIHPQLKLVAIHSKVLDKMEFYIQVTSSPELTSYFCKITAVQVNNANPPQDVTYGKPFDVQLHLQWHISPGSKIDLFLFNLNGLDLAIASDFMLILAGGDGSTVRTIQVPASEIPPQGGIWKLEAKARFGQLLNPIDDETPNGGTQIFSVNVVMPQPPGPGGNSDWAITAISTSPVNPYLGTDVAFVARVQVSTNDPLPQTVGVSYSLDGMVLKDYVTYQPGMAFLSVPSPPWTPTLGQHAVRWEVDPDKKYNDPNRANNVMDATFTVTATPPQPQQPPQGQTQPPPPPTGEAFDFYVTAVPTEQTVQSPVNYLVTVNVTAGTPQPVQLDLMGAPAGVSYYFSPPSGIPGFTSTLTVTAANTVPAGSYPLTINASSAGIVRYKPLILNIPKGPDYTLAITPDTVQVNPGEKATFTISVSSDSGYAQLVNLITSDLPSGSTAQFEPSAVAPTSQSTLTVQLSKDVAPGFYRITVTGSGVEGKRVSAILQVEGQAASAQATEATVNYLAVAILGIIVAIAVVGGVLAIRRFRTRHKKAFCIECGTELAPGIEFCPKCGTKHAGRTSG